MARQVVPLLLAGAANAQATGDAVARFVDLVGNTIAGKNSDGDPLFEFYLKNGTVKQLDDDEESCCSVPVEGNIATFTDDGSGKRYEILPGNPKRL